MASTRRKAAAIAIAVIGVAGLSLAAAAQLNIGTGSLGAGNSVVSACQPAVTPITVAFAPGAYASPGYPATQVTLGAIDAGCNNHSYRVVATGAGGIALGTEAIGSTGTATTIVVPLVGVSAAAVTGISVVIFK